MLRFTSIHSAFLCPCLPKKNKNRLKAISWCPYELFHFRSFFWSFLELHWAVTLNWSNSTPTLCTWCFTVLIADSEHIPSFFFRVSQNEGQYLELRHFWRWSVLCFPFPSPHFLFMQLPVHVRNCPGSAVGEMLQSLTLCILLLVLYYA